MDAGSRREHRANEILRASIPVFAAHGYQGSSMARIAKAAGMSRPALYQYFDDRNDLFSAAFRLLLEESTDAALEALGAPASLRAQLDGYLQRLSGDLYEALAATPHGDELMEARHRFAADAAASATKRARDGLRSHLRGAGPAGNRALNGTFELLTLSPVGLKQDHPSPDIYRQRLSFLATAAARALETP